MERAKVLQEIRNMRFEALHERWQVGPLTQDEAVEILGSTHVRCGGGRDATKRTGLRLCSTKRIGVVSARRVFTEKNVQHSTYKALRNRARRSRQSSCGCAAICALSDRRRSVPQVILVMKPVTRPAGQETSTYTLKQHACQLPVHGSRYWKRCTT